MSHPKPSHTTLRRALILLLWIGLVAVGVAPGAYSDESPANGYELPPKNTYEGSLGFGQRVHAERTKLIIRLPDTLAWIMGRPPRDPNYGLPRARPAPLPEQYQSPVPGCEARAIPNINDVYLIGRNPGGQPLGALPPTRIRALAFGSIPVTATLQLSQVVDGRLEPLRADLWSAEGNLACDPGWGTGGKTPRGFGSTKGRLSMTLADVQIDGRPVDIGARCRTVDPLDINLWADRAGEGVPGAPGAGWFPGTGGDLYQRKNDARVDVPGGYLRYPGSTDLTIPAFTGCVSAGGEDLSPLLTAMISGPGNELAVRHLQYAGVSRDDPTACATHPQTGEPICPLPAPEPPPIPVPTD